ncbi:MAG: SEC-C metal-binding domain-containing protein [Planctomycetota bacterium]
MLTGETLKPYLLHDDRWVRSAVAEYFYEGWFQDDELVPTILNACDRFGYVENTSSLACCRRFPLTPPALERVLQLLSEADRDNTAMHLSSIVARAPIDLLHEHESAVLGNKNLLENYRLSIRHRLDFMPWSLERLWQELRDLSSRYNDAEEEDSDFDSVYDDALIAALAPHDVPDTETICRLLADPESDDGWLEAFLIDLAGARRLTETIPALVEKLRTDDGLFHENCPLTLAKIGHPDIVQRIRTLFRAGSWTFRNVSASLLGEIKQPESEKAILALLPEEDDIEIRTELCFGLCQLFSERGVEIVRQQIRDGYQEWSVSLEESLLPVAQVVDVELREAEEWKKEREEKEQFQAERRREIDELGEKYATLKKQGTDPFAKLDSPRDFDPVEHTTYRRHDDKVGRNEPCTCGSGKKYKKCCGRE